MRASPVCPALRYYSNVTPGAPNTLPGGSVPLGLLWHQTSCRRRPR